MTRLRKKSNKSNHDAKRNVGVKTCALVLLVVVTGIVTRDYYLPSLGKAREALASSSPVKKGSVVTTAEIASSSSTQKESAVSSTETAFKHSFGLFDDVPQTQWETIRNKVHTHSIFKNPDNPLEKVENATYWLIHNPHPNFDCPNTVQVGGNNLEDGTKFVCNAQRLVHEEKKDCLVYSIGCAGNYRFEDGLYEMHKGKCEIHVFDPAPNWGRPNDPEVKNIHYHAWGFVSTYDHQSKSNVWPKGRGGGFKTFPDTLKELGHEGRTIDVFKIDCEGCEWSTYKDWIGQGFRQILVENHGVPTPEGSIQKPSRWFQQPLDVAAYYNEYKKHGYALFNRDDHGKTATKAVDLAFIKLEQGFWKDNA